MRARTCCVAAALLAIPAGAAATATDSLVASGQSIAFGGEAPNGTAASVDWLHQDDNRQLIGLGITRERFADAKLAIARLMGTLNLTARSSLAGTLEAGPGTQGLEHYTFTRVTVESTRVMSQALQITGGGQYIKADQARTFLLRLETVWRPLTPLFVRAQVAQSVAGNLPTRLASIRADYVHRVQFYGGVAIGRGAQAVVEFGKVNYERFTDGFVGIALPLPHVVLGLSWDLLELDSLIRRTATLTVTIILPRGA